MFQDSLTSNLETAKFQATLNIFFKYKILTVQRIISLNALLFIRKTRHFPSLLPTSVAATISKESPVPDSTHVTCENWLNSYNNQFYRKSLFFKGPLLLLSSGVEEYLSLESFLTISCYKTNVKNVLLNIQNGSDPIIWQNSNFPLYNITGLRKSYIYFKIQIIQK